MTATVLPTGAVSQVATPGRPSTARMLLGQVRFCNRGFWRTPVAAFFTLVFPLSFLVILSALTGNEVVDPETGMRLAQYTTPVFAVFGACMACYMSLAMSLAYARHAGVLKRLRGTPLPPAVHLAGRVGSALWVAALAVVIMVAVGVLLYDVELIWQNVPALVVTFAVGAGSFAALGLAVAAVAPTPSAANAFGNASLILLSFISGIFGIGDLPTWMDRIASVFPLKPFVDSFSAGFDPAADATVPDWGNLAVMLAWGVAGAVVARRAMSWEPTAAGLRPRRRGSVPEAQEAPTEGTSEVAASVPVGTVREVPRPGWPALVVGQVRYAITEIRRDPMALFFSVIFPVLLVGFFGSVYPDDATFKGLPLTQYMAPAFTVYGLATLAFLVLPGTIVDARSLRVLKRLRGTPLPPSAYLTARVCTALLLGLVTAALVFTVAVVLFPVTLPPSTWLASLLVFVLAISCFAACGLALASAIDGRQAIVAAALSILLPLSFISDIFIAVDEMPTVLDAIGWALPLRHAVAAAVTATSGGPLDATFWGHLLMLVVWGIGTALVAARWFHWEPRAHS
ncbi:MAG TPA: ABC transporter permease [Candidatus Nanopelagicales bacterium]